MTRGKAGQDGKLKKGDRQDRSTVMTRGKAAQDGQLKKGDRQDISPVMAGGQAGKLDNYARGTGKRLDISERGQARTYGQL